MTDRPATAREIADDDRLFERLILEINQAGLSWPTILKKRAASCSAFSGSTDRHRPAMAISRPT